MFKILTIKNRNLGLLMIVFGLALLFSSFWHIQQAGALALNSGCDISIASQNGADVVVNVRGVSGTNDGQNGSVQVYWGDGNSDPFDYSGWQAQGLLGHTYAPGGYDIVGVNSNNNASCGPVHVIINAPPTVVNGYWSGWGACTVLCGGGTQTRSCTPPQNGGADCSGPSIQDCNAQACAPVCVGNYRAGCYPTNSCGQSNSGTYQCDGNCSVSAPPNPANYGNACTGNPSSTNACGQSNPGGVGTYQCNGSCSGADGSTPALPAGYGTACNPANACGQSNSGTYQCNGSCSVSAPPNPVGYGTACTSLANACGQTSSGTFDCSGNCSAGTPSNASCPQPSVSIAPDASPIDWNTSTTIRWSSQNVSSCTVSPTGWTGTSGAQSTGNLTTSQVYNIQCTSAYGLGNVSQFANVVVRNPVPVASSATYSPPNYCVTGPGGWVAWSYSDPSGSPQTAYQVQILNNSNVVVVDSGKQPTSSRNYAIPSGGLPWAGTYKAQVRVWNTYDSPSPWSTPSANWTEPPYAYPDVIAPDQFTWPTVPKPQQGQPIQFTDHTVFGAGGNHAWSWNFGDGGTSTTQSPTHTFASTGTYSVHQTVTDAAGQSCSNTQSVGVIKPIPVIKEVAPK